MSKNQITCYCSAYPFPHRKHGGKCLSCRHGINYTSLYDAIILETCDFCPECAYDDGYRGEPSETLSAWERNRGAGEDWL